MIVFADELESSMRNANKYTGLYGGTLVFEEDNILRITILLDGVLKCLRTEERTFKFVLLRDVCFADICVYFAI